MDPDNPLRGPRRALRRGDAQALRYGRRIVHPDPRGAAAEEWDVGGPGNNNLMDDDQSEGGGSAVEYDNGADEDGGSMDPEAYGELVGDEMMDSGDMGEGEEEDDEGDEGDEGEVGEYEYDGTQQEEEEEEEMQDGDEDEGDDDDDDETAPVFDPQALGLKEINNLAHFSVSSHKPGSGVAELLSDDLSKYWQSDGPQPHLLTIHFLRRVEIRAIRFYVDYNQDESYTPTSVMLSAGTGHHDLQPFLMVGMTNPTGWQDVDLGNVGGGADGRSLCCWIVQLQVKENHQNGKDTHIRGIKLYAIDENAPPPLPPLQPQLPPAHRPSAEAATAAAAAEATFARAPPLLPDPFGPSSSLLFRNSSPLHRGSFPSLAYDARHAPPESEDAYLLEQLLTRAPEQLDSVLESAGTMDNLMRDMEIR